MYLWFFKNFAAWLRFKTVQVLHRKENFQYLEE